MNHFHNTIFSSHFQLWYSAPALSIIWYWSVFKKMPKSLTTSASHVANTCLLATIHRPAPTSLTHDSVYSITESPFSRFHISLQPCLITISYNINNDTCIAVSYSHKVTRIWLHVEQLPGNCYFRRGRYISLQVHNHPTFRSPESSAIIKFACNHSRQHYKLEAK